MKSYRRAVLAFSGILLFTAVVHADMMPVSQEDAVYRQASNDCAPSDLHSKTSPDSFNYAGATNLDLWTGELLPEAAASGGQTSEMQQVQVLSEGHNSLEFCLSALISLGLCCSAHWVKRLSLGFVPDWYHEGGPFQIGHSHALLPCTLYPVPVCCFIQPECIRDNPLTKFCLKTVVSFWRKSQFTPIVLASRGPPEMS